MGYLYPEPQAGLAPTYLLPVGILGMVRYDWVLLAMRWEHQTQQGQDPTILRVQGKRGASTSETMGASETMGTLQSPRRRKLPPSSGLGPNPTHTLNPHHTYILIPDLSILSLNSTHLLISSWSHAEPPSWSLSTFS